MDLGISSSGGEKKWQFDQWQGRKFYDITPGCRTNENNNNNNNNNNDNNHYYHHLCSVRVAQNTTTRGPRKKTKQKNKKQNKTKTKKETKKIRN